MDLLRDLHFYLLIDLLIDLLIGQDFQKSTLIFSRVATKRSDQIYYFMLAKKGRVHNGSSNFYNDTVHKLENGDAVSVSESLHVDL